MAVFKSDEVQGADGVSTAPPLDMEKNVNTSHDVVEVNSESGYNSDKSEEFQPGVQEIRAITSIWSKPMLITMFVLLYLINFVEFFQNSLDSALTPYVTSFFDKHGLLNVGSVIATALGGCIPLATAKVIDIWGRVEGFAFMLLLVVIGMIMKAVCTNMETYIAAHAIYWAGHIGVLYVVDIMCADITSLKNRMIIFTINGTPRIAGTFAGPKIAESFLTKLNFRWAYGAFTIILVGCCIPAMAVMICMSRKARKAGLVKRQRSGRTIPQSIVYYIIQLDVIGILLIMLAFCFFLLPFSLVAYAPNGWKTGYIIAMIVLGILFFPVFAAWEKYWAPVQFMPWVYLKNGTIIGSSLLYGVMFLSCFVWNAYFNSYLQVVHRQSITHAGYILNAFSLTSAALSPFIALWISWSGDFKWTAYVGAPITLLGTALLIPFRAPDTAPGVLALTQVLVGLGTGIFATCGQLAVMAPVTHQQLAVVNALWGLFGSFGSSIGFAIAGAMWNNILPVEIEKRLPEESKHLAATIFGDMVMQMSYADGTPERDAIVGAYSDVMRKMVIAGACFIPLCLGSIYLWKNINVKKLEEEQGKQTKGVVF